MKLVISALCLSSILCLSEVTALNILGIFPYQGKSHFFVFEPYLKELANRGHNLTVISHFPQKTQLKNYQDISLAGSVKILESYFPIERSYLTILQVFSFLVDFGTDNCRQLLANKNVQNLWKTKTKFDLVIVEQFNSDCPLGLAYHLGAPVVGLTSHIVMPWHFKRFGIPNNPSYVPFMMLEGGTKPTLYQRIERLIFDAYSDFQYKYFSQRVDENTLSKYFDYTPDLESLGRDIKILLTYQDFVLTGSRLLPANVKEVGGYHVAKPKPLPEDLQRFIDNSEHGVIYISFGSMLRAKTVPNKKLTAILDALAELPQRVIWKWEEKTMPGNPKNVFLSDWLPQNDILAHPKVLAFYSHTGLLGTTEAIYHGVPIVAMPIFGDQPSNAAAVEESGLGVQVKITELTKEVLLEAFKTVLDPKFRNKVKQLSKAWHDRPMSPMDSAIFWTEYAARHSHLPYRSPAADVPFYQKLHLDILALVAVALLAVTIVLKTLCSARKSKSLQNVNRKKAKKA